MDEEDLSLMPSDFLGACTAGDLPRVRALLDHGYSPNGTGGLRKRTPLTVSARRGHHDVVDHLIARGADVDKKDGDDRTALHRASGVGHLKVVEVLLDAGAKVDVVDKDHFTPLMRAAYGGHHDVVSRLITRGADVNKKDGDDRTALHRASGAGHLKVVEVLLNLGAEVNVVDREHFTPLMRAARGGYHDVVSCLITRGADVDKKNGDDRTALHWASRRGHLKVVEALIDAGAKVDAEEGRHITPLMWAAAGDHLDIVSYLIARGANVDKKDWGNGAAIHWASDRGYLKVVDALLNAGAEVDVVDNEFTPLMWAAGGGHLEVVSRLITSGAKIDKKDWRGLTALHWAIVKGHLKVIKAIILNSGAKVATDHSTPPMQAHPTEYASAVSYLLEHGVLPEDYTQPTEHVYSDPECLGREVLSYAVNHNHRNAVNILITNAVGIEGLLSTSPPMTALMWTAREGDDTLTKQLILQGVNIDDQNPDGRTSLHFASQNNHIQCGILLVEAGADLSVVNNASQTPLDLSSGEFKEAILQTLSFQTKKSVCVIGNASSGKSTLVASLQNENASFVKKIRNRLFGVRSITKRTAGIEPVSLSSKRYGDVMFYDFAGQHEYHGPHEMFLESILSKGLSTVTIIVVVKATENESNISHQLNRWLQPFSKIPSSANPVRVNVIGSHMDKVKHKAETKEKMELCYKRVKDSLRDAHLEFNNPCYLDCRQPYSNDITKLYAYLNEVPPPQYKARDTGYIISWVISQVCSFFEDKVIPVSAFSEWIAHNKANVSTNLPPAEEVCKDLSSTGHFLYLPSKEGVSNGWLVLDLPSILHEVYGTLFSPSKKIVNKFGLLSCQRLSVLFPTLDPSMVHDVLISLEFCVEVDPSILPEAIHMMDSSDEGHKHLFFPALVSAEPPKAFDPPSEASHTLSWQLVVTQDVFISPRLLQTIILRLAAHHIFHELEGSEYSEHYSKVWWNGIFWQSTKDVDVAVQISDNAVIQVIGRSEVSSEVLCRYISTITEDIFATICDLSPRLSGTAYVIHSVNPQVLLEQPKSPSPQEMFPVNVIMRSVKNGGLTCLSCGTDLDAAVRKPIFEIFGGFQPSMEIIEGLYILQCSPPSPSNQINLAANRTIQAAMTTAVDQYHKEKELVQMLLNKFRGRFHSDVDSHAVYRRLLVEGVIPNRLAFKIENNPVEDSNDLLFLHLRDHGNMEALRRFCDILITVGDGGYRRMLQMGQCLKDSISQHVQVAPPQDVHLGTHRDTPFDTVQDTPLDTAQDTPLDTVQDALQNICQDTPYDTPQKVPRNTLLNKAQDTTKNVPLDTPQDVLPGHTSISTS